MNGSELNWQDLRLFLTVAEEGSFSAAARYLKVGQPTLSRRIAELESKLGSALFIREAQGCQLTDIGRELLPSVQQMAVCSSNILTQLNTPTEISGRVRITAPPAIAHALLTSFAAAIAKTYPAVQLDILSSVRTLNLSRGEADIALRTEKPKDEGLICIASFKTDMKVFVSNSMAKSLSSSSDLSALKWICWPAEYDHMNINKVLKRLMPSIVPTFTSDDFNVQIAACCAGVGAMILPDGFERCERLNTLTPLPIDLSGMDYEYLYLVTHKRQRHVPRVVKITEKLALFLDKA